MAKINMSLNANRDVTEHFAAGEHKRIFERRMIAAHLPGYVASMGLAVPRYNGEGQPVTVAAYKATKARKARLLARKALADKARADSMAARKATAARLSDTLSATVPATVEDVDSYPDSLDITAAEFEAARAELLATI